MAFEIRIAIEVVLLIMLFLAAAAIWHYLRHLPRHREPESLPTPSVDEANFERLIQQHEELEAYRQRETEKEPRNQIHQ